eukprot:15434694-Alexandrium_andersonii.AAC.1
MSSNPARHQQRKTWRRGPHGLAKADNAFCESRACPASVGRPVPCRARRRFAIHALHLLVSSRLSAR